MSDKNSEDYKDPLSENNSIFHAAFAWLTALAVSIGAVVGMS